MRYAYTSSLGKKLSKASTTWGWEGKKIPLKLKWMLKHKKIGFLLKSGLGEEFGYSI
jgi:hypothetical protein